MAGCHMPPPLYVPLPAAACGTAGPHQFLHNGTSLLAAPWLDTTFPPSGQHCLLLLLLPAADMHSSDLAKAAPGSHTFLCSARNLKCNQCMPAAQGSKYFPVTADRACHPG